MFKIPTRHFLRPLLRSQLRPFSTVQTEPAEKSEPSSIVLPDTLKHHDYFNVRRIFTIKEMVDARVHLGHKVGTLNPHMAPYVFGERLGHLIIDLDQTAELLGDALNIIAQVAYRGGLILFLNRQRQTGHIIEKMAKEVGEYAHCRHWKVHTLLNSDHMFNARIRYPDLMVFTNTTNNVFEQHTAIRDAAKMLIPTVGVVDTAVDPTLVTYPVPGNDDTPCAIEFYCRVFAEAVRAGKRARQQVIDKYGIEPN